MSHMQVSISRGTWIEVEGDGTEYVPIDYTPLCHKTNVTPGWSVQRFYVGFAEAVEAMRDYLEMRPDSIVRISCRVGWGAQLTAPGYLDCTPWTVFDTRAEAEEHAREYLEP
jgi:hypothetical protein